MVIFTYISYTFSPQLSPQLFSYSLESLCAFELSINFQGYRPFSLTHLPAMDAKEWEEHSASNQPADSNGSCQVG